MKRKFIFHIDQKVAMWRRDYYEVESDTEEDAISSMKSINNILTTQSINSEILFETEFDMSYEENGNQPTIEVYYNDEVIADNTPLDIRRDKKINKIIDEEN